jgi:hypothetical protein
MKITDVVKEDITRRGFLQGAGAAAVAGTAGPAMAQLGKTKIAVQVGELDTGTQQYEPVNSGQARNFVYAYDSSVFIMKWVDSKGNNISEGEVFQARGSGTDFKDRPNTLYFSSKNAVKIVPSGSPEGDLIYFTPRNWIDQKIGWRSVYYQMFSNVKESVNHDINEGWTDTIKSNFQLPVIKKLMAAIEPYKNQVLQINNQAKKMQSQGLPPNEIKQFLQTNITSIGSNIANNTLITESEEFTKEEIAQLYKLISRQQWLTYLPLLLTFIYDQLKLPNIWGDRGVYWWAYAWWIIIAIVNELSIREKKKKLDVIGAKDPDQELMGRLDKIKEQGMEEGIRVPAQQILGTKNRAKSAYYPTNVKPKVPKLDKPLTDQELARLAQLAGIKSK